MGLLTVNISTSAAPSSPASPLCSSSDSSTSSSGPNCCSRCISISDSSSSVASLCSTLKSSSGRPNGDRDFIAHSLDLFIDFVQIFRKVLILLMQKDERDNKNKRR